MMSRLTIVALMLAGAATPALAQQSAVRDACMADIRKFCSAQMAAMDRDAVRACLRTNIANTSPECQAAVKAQQAANAAAQGGQAAPASSKPN